MGAKGKTKRKTKNEELPPSWTKNCSAPARNLRKNDLGAVIFGCKHNTMNECLSKQLFGLPAPHFAYVRSIRPGLPLFLFNYSDRKLYGVFEAATQGQLHIDRYAWTANDADETPYPAQIRVQVLGNCKYLHEDEFRAVISGNYYKESHFWFELDRTQTCNLIKLFEIKQVPANAPRLGNTDKSNIPFIASSTPGIRQTSDHTGNLVSEADFGQSEQVNMQLGSWDAVAVGGETNIDLKSKCDRSYASVLCKTSSSLPPLPSLEPKKWSALFETSSGSDTIKNHEHLVTQSSKSSFAHSGKSIMKGESSCDAPYLKRGSQLLETCADEWTAGQYGVVELKSSCPYSSAPREVADLFLQNASYENLPTAGERLDNECFQRIASELNLSNSDESNMEWGSSCVTPDLDGESQALEDSVDEDAELILTNETNSEDNHENNNGHLFSAGGEPVEDRSFSVAVTVIETKSADEQSVVAKLMHEIEGLKESHFEQMLKISSMEKELVQSKLEIQQWKRRCNLCGPCHSSRHVEQVECESWNIHLAIDDSVLIVGGYDGSSWLSALCSYSPYEDIVKSLSPMTFKRSYASAAKLNGELYIFGGVDGDVWYDTVESYNPKSKQWVHRPPLNRKKGSLAGASLHGTIFAIGGGNGVDCFSDVEMFDLNTGRWIYTQSMQKKRFAPAAADINGTLYVVGGFDGRDYLKSVERFDPREHSWTRMRSMSTRRGCHSLVALNEKLYAIGGFDGTKMVSTVEVFDPRIGSWMNGQPMKNSRGYSGAVVIGGKVYVIGGLNDTNQILDTIESYEEGYDWELTSLKAVGKRCFFSALVL